MTILQQEAIGNEPASNNMIDFSSTEIAFKDKTDRELNRAQRLFRLMNRKALVKAANRMALTGIRLKLPIKWLIKRTVFAHFCGGESIADCLPTVKRLSRSGIKSILDYSVEGGNTESDFDRTANEILTIINTAINNPGIAITSLKMNGLARHDLMKKVHAGEAISSTESEEYERVRQRLGRVCKAAFENDIPIYIDAEESWIQNPIDELTLEMMRKYNKEKAIVYNTLQMYLRDKIEALRQQKEIAEKEGFVLGMKFVRGAYWEKEREVAGAKGFPSPVWDYKEETDRAYNDALTYSVEHLGRIAICNATHNEESTLWMTQLMEKHGIDKKHPHCWFSQLMGMSDHITYNLAHAGYNVVKYVPYGPIPQVLPYLIRRAEENTAIAGQMGRELRLIIEERKRRK